MYLIYVTLRELHFCICNRSPGTPTCQLQSCRGKKSPHVGSDVLIRFLQTQQQILENRRRKAVVRMSTDGRPGLVGQQNYLQGHFVFHGLTKKHFLPNKIQGLAFCALHICMFQNSKLHLTGNRFLKRSIL